MLLRRIQVRRINMGRKTPGSQHLSQVSISGAAEALEQSQLPPATPGSMHSGTWGCILSTPKPVAHPVIKVRKWQIPPESFRHVCSRSTDLVATERAMGGLVISVVH